MSYEVGFVLPGGGSKGISQLGQIEVLSEAGIKPDIISGISVGSLNAAMLSKGKLKELQELWDTIEKKDVYKGKINIRNLLANYFGWRRSLYDNSPLSSLLEKYLSGGTFESRLLMGAVPLETGNYFCWDSATHSEEMLTDIVLASASLPVLWEPVKQIKGLRDWVDGGVAVQSPLKDISEFHPKTIFILHTQPKGVDPVPKLKRVWDVGIRAFEVLMYHGLRKDISETKRINSIIEQMPAGMECYKKNGEAYKHFDLVEIYPDFDDKPNVIDFDRDTLKRMREAGREAAKAKLKELGYANV